MRAKFTFRDVPIEAEAETKQDLEDALEAATNVVARLLGAPPQVTAHVRHNGAREPETPSATKGLVSAPPPQPPQAAGGATPPQWLLDLFNGSLPQVSYEDAETIADHARIALTYLGEARGTEEGFTTREVLDFLEATGSNALEGNKEPIRGLGQALRERKQNEEDKQFVRINDRNKLTEWLDTPRSDDQSGGWESSPLSLGSTR